MLSQIQIFTYLQEQSPFFLVPHCLTLPNIRFLRGSLWMVKCGTYSFRDARWIGFSMAALESFPCCSDSDFGYAWSSQSWRLQCTACFDKPIIPLFNVIFEGASHLLYPLLKFHCACIDLIIKPLHTTCFLLYCCHFHRREQQCLHTTFSTNRRKLWPSSSLWQQSE